MERASKGTDDLRLRDMVARLQETRVRFASADTRLTEGDDILLVTTSGGNVTVSLPSARQVLGHKCQIKKMTAANTLTVDADGTDTIDGSGTLAWSTQYQSMTVVSCFVAPNVAGWVIV